MDQATVTGSPLFSCHPASLRRKSPQRRSLVSGIIKGISILPLLTSQESQQLQWFGQSAYPQGSPRSTGHRAQPATEPLPHKAFPTPDHGNADDRSQRMADRREAPYQHRDLAQQSGKSLRGDVHGPQLTDKAWLQDLYLFGHLNSGMPRSNPPRSWRETDEPPSWISSPHPAPTSHSLSILESHLSV